MLAIERILRLRESVLGIVCLLHGFKRRLDLQRFRRHLQGISLFLSIVGSVFKSREPGALHTLQRIGGFPRFALIYRCPQVSNGAFSEYWCCATTVLCKFSA